MSLTTTWYHIEITFPDQDNVLDKLPARTEDEMRAQVARMYPAHRGVIVHKVEEREQRQARFDPHSAFSEKRRRKINEERERLKRAAESTFGRAPQSDSATAEQPLDVECACGETVTLTPPFLDRVQECPSCGLRFRVSRGQGGWAVEVVEEERVTFSDSVLSSMEPHRVLGIEEGATPEEVRTAYTRLIKQYHPDRVASLGPELRELAERKAKEINRAYAILKRRSR